MTITADSEFRSDYWRDFAERRRAAGRAEGRVEGEAAALLTILAARDIDVPDDAHARITGCTDLHQLQAWIRRAITATSVKELFES